MDNKTKISIILEHLQNGEYINDMKAVELAKSYRLSSIIFSLRKQGYDIRDRWIQNENTGSRYKEYYLYNK